VRLICFVAVFAAIAEGREPNASVAQVLPAYQTLDRLEKSLK